MTGKADTVVPADASIVDAVRQQADVSPLPDVARFLLNLFPARLVTYACGLESTKPVKAIGSGEKVEGPPGVEARLRRTYEVVLLLLHFDAPAPVQAWFIGMSPELGDTALVDAVRDGRFDDAMGAARAFITHG